MGKLTVNQIILLLDIYRGQSIYDKSTEDSRVLLSRDLIEAVGIGKYTYTNKGDTLVQAIRAVAALV